MVALTGDYGLVSKTYGISSDMVTHDSPSRGSQEFLATVIPMLQSAPAQGKGPGGSDGAGGAWTETKFRYVSVAES